MSQELCVELPCYPYLSDINYQMIYFSSVIDSPIPTLSNYAETRLKIILRQDWSAGAMSQEMFNNFECDNIDDVDFIAPVEHIISQNESLFEAMHSNEYLESSSIKKIGKKKDKQIII